MTSKQQTSGILTPHEHDVLSGRGNFVNYHAGNEHFRALVRKHKLEYVRCPKPQKGKFSRMIVDEIRNRMPPGRFLKQDGATKLWYDIGEKKALDKTRQALREGAPDIIKEISGDEAEDDDDPVDSLGVDLDVFHSMGGNMGNPAILGGGGLSHPYGHVGNNMGNMLPSNAGLAQQVLANSGMMMQNSQISSNNNVSQMQALQSLSNHGQPIQSLSNHGQGLSHSNHSQGLSHSNHGQGLSHSNHGQGLSLSNHGQALSLSNHGHSNHSQVNAIQDQYAPQMVMSGGGGMNRQTANINQGMNQGVNQGMPYGDTQGMQNKLASIFPVGQFEPRPLVQEQQYEKPRQSAQSQERAAPAPAQNPRRKPPPSLLKRDDSLKMEKVFSGDAAAKNKYDDNGSSTHMSAMSLSIGDMQDDGNLSSVFDSSLRISAEGKNNSKVKRSSQETTQETSSSILTGSAWDAASHTMDMSVNTFGAGHSVAGEQASFATYDNKMNESEGNMSFSRVFEDPDKGL